MPYYPNVTLKMHSESFAYIPLIIPTWVLHGKIYIILTADFLWVPVVLAKFLNVLHVHYSGLWIIPINVYLIFQLFFSCHKLGVPIKDEKTVLLTSFMAYR
jgi:hypothetical protein